MAADLLTAPAYRYRGPIIDAHCQVTNVPATARNVEAGRLYGVVRWMGILRQAQVATIRRNFPGVFGFSVWTDHRDTARRDFLERNLRTVHEAAAAGAHCIKFWYKPEFNARSGWYFDDPRLDPLFTAICDHGLPALVHIADPDLWWNAQYKDAQRFEAKRFTYRQLTNTLGRFLVAHLGGWPENLPFLDEMLDGHPNCYLDTSATKWMARELSRQPEAARAFMIRNAKRLLFGSDLVPFKRVDVAHHCSRYYVLRHLLEMDGPIVSPIEDPDAGGPVTVHGLALPPATLKQLYHDNAHEFFALDARP